MEPAPVSTESNPSAPFESEVIEGPIIPKPKSKLPLILVGIVVVAAITGGGYLLGLKHGLLKTPSVAPIPTSTPVSATPTPDPTADWQIYTSSKGKYSIKYPKEWTLKGDEYYQEDIAMGTNSIAKINSPDVNFNNRISIVTNITSTDQNLQKAKEILELWRENSQGELKEITINGIFGYKLVWIYSDPVAKESRIDVRLENSGLLYDIELAIDYKSPNKDELLQTGNQILSTFKFLDQTDGANSDLIKAKEALTNYFSLLNEKKYTQAVDYHGSSWETLRGWNPNINPNDYSGLLESGCEHNGLNCLKIKSFLQEEVISPTEFSFLIQFMNNDGTLFERGPCCGATEETMPTQTDFEFKVKKQEENYLVITQPVYIP